MLFLSTETTGRTLAILLSVSVALSLGGCNRAVDVTSKPGEAADQDLAESQPAAVIVTAPVDLARVEDEIAKLLPSEAVEINKRIAHAACSTVKGQQVCLDMRLAGHVVRDGQARFEGTNNGLDLKVPLRYDLVAQPFGAGAPVNITGKVTAVASYGMGLDEHWQTSVKLQPGFKWDEGVKFKVSAADVSVQADLEPYLTGHLGKLAPAAAAGLVPAELKHRVEVVWRFLHYPIALSQEQQIWLRGTPLGLRYAGIANIDGTTHVRMAITARLQTFVGNRPAPLPPSPLAVPGSGPEPTGGGVLLPAEVSYDVLAAAAKAHLPAIPQRSVAGEAATPDAQVKSLAFYASGHRLAVAVHFAAMPSGGWFSGHPVAYFLATPVVKPGTAQIGLGQTDFYAPSLKPSAILKDMPFLADGRFAANVGAALELDVADKLTAAIEMVRRHADVPLTQGLKLTMTPSTARIAKINPGIDSLHLQIEVGGMLAVHREGTDVAADNPVAVPATP